MRLEILAYLSLGRLIPVLYYITMNSNGGQNPNVYLRNR